VFSGILSQISCNQVGLPAGFSDAWQEFVCIFFSKAFMLGLLFSVARTLE
jgi:hypothetical protein